jgi:hypothetical protein
MKCPICGAELQHWDSFGRLAAHQDGKVLGQIYKCPNGAEQNGTCDSESFSVVGSFYVYETDGVLREGFPC